MELILLLIAPILFTIGGIILAFFTPKNINSIFGYKTGQSQKNQLSWIAGNKYFGKLLLKFGITYFIICCILVILSYVNDISLIFITLSSYVIEIITLIILICKTEKYLRLNNHNS